MNKILKVILFCIPLFLGIQLLEDEYVEVQSNPRFSVSTDTTTIMYTVPVAGVYKLSISNDVADTVVYKIKKTDNTIFYHRILTTESYNRIAWLDKGSILYLYTTAGTGGAIREEIFKKR